MVDSFTGEIRLTAWQTNRTPYNWHLCDGTLLQISTYQVLYSLIGTIYGGDGVTTFRLPDLRGRLPIGAGTGTGLTPRTVGQAVGTETATLSVANLPVHSHTMNVVNSTATASLSGSQATLGYGLTTSPTVQYLKDIATAGATVSPNDATIGATGSGIPHENIMPSMALSYFICLNGLYPTRA